MTQIITLWILAFLAGLIDMAALREVPSRIKADSIVSGGLIQLLALLVLLPNIAIPSIMGTNKLSAIAGTAVAAIHFYRVVKISPSIFITSAIAAFILSFLGAKTVSIIHPNIIRPIILLLLLIIVIIYTFFKKDFGVQYFYKYQDRKQLTSAAIISSLLGFYDSFLELETGSFLIFAFGSILDFNFLKDSVVAKVVNFSINLSSIIYFAYTNNIIYPIALLIVVCNMLGAIAHLLLCGYSK